MNTSKKVLALIVVLMAGFSTGCGEPSDASQAAQRVGDRVIEEKKQSIKDLQDLADAHGTDQPDVGVVDSSRFGQATVDELMTRCEELEQEAFEKEFTPEWTQEAYYRFAVVEHVVSNVGEASAGTSVHRRYLVNPIGEWYKIPESDREWALTVKEGAVVELPATVMLWVKVDQSTVRYHGSYMIDALDGEHRSFVSEAYSGHDEGIIFFVEKKDFEDRKYQ